MKSRSPAAFSPWAALFTVLLLVGSSLAPSRLHAQASFGLMAGTEYGVGVTTRLGVGSLTLEGGAGFVPLLVYVNVEPGDDIINLYFPATFGAKAAFAIGGSSVAQMEIEGGVTYSSLLKLGFGGGVNFRPGGARFVLSAGLMVYPDAKDEIRLRVNEDEGTNFTDANFSLPLGGLQPYVGVALYFGLM